MQRTFGLEAADEIRELVPVVPTEEVDRDFITATVKHVCTVVNPDNAASRAYRHRCIVV